MHKDMMSKPLPLKQAKIADGFWSGKQKTVREEVIPYQWKALNDEIPDAAPSYCMHNFRVAARMMKNKQAMGAIYQEPHYTYRGFESLPEEPRHPDEDKFYGFVFQDSDFSKWIEAVAYSLSQQPDAFLEQTADAAIDVVCAAQHDTGYLDTYYIINGMDRAFTNLKDHHELYCMGHLIEGAVAYYEATGKDKLLKAAARFADYAAERFGEGKNQCKGYPGHEIAEMALVRLYEVTGEKRYLDLSSFFINQRGTQPYYFDEETEQNAKLSGNSYKPNTALMRYAYHQAHRPVREQDEAVGHAVRAGYLYCGMADIARQTQDELLIDACRQLWRNIVDKKLYITGGIGGTCHGEAFSYPYDLPNDTAYSETCAAVSLVFFARRMLQLEPKAEYGDVMELALYNTVLAGMALDGKSFFYVNPLEVVPEACYADERLSHVKPVRQKWFGCACCPPNIARTVSSVTAYAYTENADTVWVHLYVGGMIEKKVGEKTLRFEVMTDMPWSGNVRLEIRNTEKIDCTIAFRLPGWCDQEKIGVKLKGVSSEIERTDRDGYCYLKGGWENGSVVELEFPMYPHMLSANPNVRENIGKVAFMRGPLVYCAEEADNGKNLHLYKVDTAKLAEAGMGNVVTGKGSINGQEMVFLDIPVLKETGWEDSGSYLYTDYQNSSYCPTNLRLIPYYAWANRGKGEMRVWLRI